MAKSSGLSFHPKDAIVGGGIGLGPGKAKVVKARFGKIVYKNKAGVATRKPTTALLLTLKRGDESAVESYTVGEGFKPSDDGKSLVPLQSQSGLQDSCKTMRLLKSMWDHGMPDNAYDDLVKDISGMQGLIALWVRKTLPKIEHKGKPDNREPPTVFLVDEILKSPWELDEKRGAKPADDDEAEDEDEGDEEEDEKDDDEEEEEESPKKKPKGKKKPADDDDDEDSDEAEDEDEKDEAEESDDTDEDVAEEAAEKLLDALEDGDLKKSKIQDAVTAAAKKDKATKAKASAIGKYAASDALLKKEQGWSWDGKVAKKD